MASLVSVDLLKPHPKNGEYFDDPTPEDYEQIKHSIVEHGIRDPLKVLPDYTVVAGCLRLRVAKELGFTHVPVEIWDVSGEEAEYLLVADNEERRECVDPVKKARRAEFLRRYWGVREGPGRPKKSGRNYPISRTLDDVADAVGEERENLKKLLKLNDLVPPLQDLVSGGKLGQTAAYSLAFLPAEEQERLLAVLGESGLGGLSVGEARELRRQLEAERARIAFGEERIRDLEKRLAVAREKSEEAHNLAAELVRLRAENEALRAKEPEVVEKVVEKVVGQRDPAADREVATLRKQVDSLTGELTRLSTPVLDKERLEEELQRKRAELQRLHHVLSRKQHLAALLRVSGKLFDPLHKEQEVFFEHLCEAEMTPLARQRLLTDAGMLRLFVSRIEETLKKAAVVEDAAYEVDAGADLYEASSGNERGEEDGQSGSNWSLEATPEKRGLL